MAVAADTQEMWQKSSPYAGTLTANEREALRVGGVEGG